MVGPFLRVQKAVCQIVRARLRARIGASISRGIRYIAGTLELDNRTIRLVASDLDGTLLRNDGTLSARTLRALAALRACGIPLVLVTARPPRTVRLLTQQIGGGLAICGNGAIIYDLEREAIEAQTILAAAIAGALIADLRAAIPGVTFAIEAGLRYGEEPDYAPTERDPTDGGCRSPMRWRSAPRG